MLKFDTSGNAIVAFDIAKRAYALRKAYAARGTENLTRKPLELAMDLLATHSNGCPLDFARLEKADDFNLLHDVIGIEQHLNRKTGKLEGCFLPRFALACQEPLPSDPPRVKQTINEKRKKKGS